MIRTVFAAGLMVAAAWGQAPAADVKMAEQVFKNIVELKGTPADQVAPAMQFISSSLGVSCEFCHVGGKPEADDKGPKKTAREMMHMQAEINKSSFRGQKQVTCYSCHRGAQRPANTPAALESDAPARPAAGLGGPRRTANRSRRIRFSEVRERVGADAIRKLPAACNRARFWRAARETPIECTPRLRTSASRFRTARMGTASRRSTERRDGWAMRGGRRAKCHRRNRWPRGWTPSSRWRCGLRNCSHS